MLHSEHRILTTHTGSLPRPPALTELYARRAAGETVDAQADRRRHRYRQQRRANA
jgi:5-methyltetrahydropteroyltriglutamate--homocysteine methyltransferase